MDQSDQPSGREDRRPLVIAFGGTGVIGSALRRVALGRGLRLLTFSLDPDSIADGWRNIRLDLADSPKGVIRRALERAVPRGAKIAALCSIAGLPPDRISEVLDFAGERGAPVAQVSSCLLYQPDAAGAVDEDTGSYSATDLTFPYIQLKLAEEAALTASSRVDWRILRTQHVLGRGGLLGCLPDHNRDPNLLAKMRAGDPLRLVRSGKVLISWIHAEDLAAALLDLCSAPQTCHQILNVVHPEPVEAASYFREVASLLGVAAPDIRPLVPEPTGFWALTARENHYVSRHPAVLTLSFRHDLTSALRDALFVGEIAYALLGGHMRHRLDGR